MQRRLFCTTLFASVISPAFSIANNSKQHVLFNGKNLDHWKTHDAGGSGEVSVENQQLILGAGESLTGLIYQRAAQLPSLTHYEIELEAKRLEGLDFFVGLTFPVGNIKTCATLVLGGWGGSVTGISCINGMDAAENNTGHYRRYEDQRWYQVKLQVSTETIKVWNDKDLIIEVDVKDTKFSLRPGPIEDYAPLSLTTYQTKAALRNIQYRAL